MSRTILGLLLWSACTLLPACGTPSPSGEDSGPPPDAREAVETIDVAPDVEVTDAGSDVPEEIPPIVIVPEAPAKCGWFTNGNMPIYVEASHEPGIDKGNKGIAKMQLFYLPPGGAKEEDVDEETVSAPEQTGEHAGKWKLAFDVNNSFNKKLLAGDQQVVVDGPYKFRIKAVSKVVAADGNAVTGFKDVTVFIDRTPPVVAIDSPDPRPEDGEADFVESKFIEKFSPTVSVYEGDNPDTEDTVEPDGSGIRELLLTYGQEHPPADEPDPARTTFDDYPTSYEVWDVVFDISGFKTTDLDCTDPEGDPADCFQVQATDCVQNTRVQTAPMLIVATPRYEAPTTIPTFQAADGKDLVGAPTRLLAADENDDGSPDLVLAGKTGVVVFPWDPEAAEGGFNPPGHKLGKDPADAESKELDVTDLRLVNVNGDKDEDDRDVLDIVAVSPIQGGGVTVQVFVQQEMPDPKDETKKVRYYDATPTQTLKVTSANAHVTLVEVADMNGDDLPDIVLAGPEQTFSVAVILHVPLDPENVDEEGNPLPQQPPFFAKLNWDTDVFTGVSGITSLALADLNDDKLKDLVMGRDGSDLLYTLLNNGTGRFDIAHNTVVPAVGTALVAARDLDEDGIDDVITTGTQQNALFAFKSTGTGYFVFDPIDEDAHVYGEKHVASLVDSCYFMDLQMPGTNAAGDVLSVSQEPDSIVVADFDNDKLDDLAVAIPKSNQIGIFLRQQDPLKFRETVFVNPGPEPRQLVAADFNGDKTIDLACLVDEGKYISFITNSKATPGVFVAARELPMPVGYNWTNGRLTPSRLAVEDTNADKKADIVVLTEPDTVVISAKDACHESEEGGAKKQLSLILTYLSNGVVPTFPAYKSVVDVGFDQTITGLALANFEGDDPDGKPRPDLAVTLFRTAENACDGRTFDILRGGYQPQAALVADKDPLKSPLGGNGLHYYQVGTADGYFWPLGGFLGLQSPSGLAHGDFNQDGRADLVLLAAEQGTPTKENYFPDTVAVYISHAGTQYSTCAVNPEGCVDYCPQELAEEVWFDCAPYWPLQQTSPLLCQEEPPSDTYTPGCMPAGNNDLCADPALMAKRQEGAWAADQTEQGECGRQPVAAAVGNFDGDDLSCLDILVAGAKDGDVTYLRGECVKEGETFAYLGFHKPGVEVERFSVGNDPVDVAASDLDGDGLADAVVALKDNIAVLWGKAEGAPFSTPVYLVTADVGPITPASVALEDVNNDGHLDIVIADSSRNQVVVYANAQGRDFLGPYGVPTGAKPVAARAVKLEGDACPALAVVNQDARSVTLHRSLKCEQ